MSKPVFHQPNLEILNQRAEEASSRQSQDSNFSFQNLEPGSNRFIVCPPYNDLGLYVKKQFNHWRMGQAGNSRIHCPQATNPNSGINCPVCYVLSQLARDPEIPDDALKVFRPGATTYLNALMIEVGGKPVDFNEIPWSPRILSGPSMLGDWIHRNWREVPDFANPEGACPITVKKIKKNKTTNYEISWFPNRMAIGNNEEEFAQIAAGISDLDVVFKNSWVEDTWSESIGLANWLLGVYRYEEIDAETFATVCPPPVAQEDSKPEKKMSPGPSVAPPKPSAAPKAISPPAAAKKVSPVQKAGPSPLPAKPSSPRPVVLAKKGASSVSSDDVERDPENLGDDGNPKCFGHHDNLDVCSACNFLDICVVESLNRVGA